MKIYAVVEVGRFGIFKKVVCAYMDKKHAEIECERRNTSNRFRGSFLVVKTKVVDYTE